MARGSIHVAAIVLVASAAIVLLSAVNIEAFDPKPAAFWWLNTFLSQKTIGRYEPPGFGPGYIGTGPCPSYGEKCKLDFTTLPQSVKNIGVRLPAPFDNTVTLGEALPSGYANIWMVEASDVELKNVEVGGRTLSPAKETLRVVAQALKLNAKMELQLVDIKIPGVLDLWAIDVTVDVAKSRQTTGTGLDLQLTFAAPQGKNLSYSIPNNVTVDNCTLTTNLGLQLTIKSSYPFNDLINTVTGFITGIAEPLAGYVICGAIDQLIVTVGGEPGLVTETVNHIYSAIGNLSSLPDPNVDVEEQKIISKLSNETKLNAISFRDNLAVKGASNVINEWLGTPNGNPFANEAVNLLTAPDNGTAKFSDLISLGFSTALSTPVFDIELKLINATLKGLNTLERLELLKNNYDKAPNLRDEYTLENRLKVRSAGLQLLLDLKLSDNVFDGYDGWIFRRPGFTGQSSTELRVLLDAGLSDLDLAIFLTIVNEPGALHDRQLGQLLGKSTLSTTFAGQLAQAGKCAAPAMHAFAIPFFELGLSDLWTPKITLTPVDVGLTSLLNNSTARILSIIEAALTRNLVDISQHWLRPTINELAASAFVSDSEGSECPDYESQAKTTPNFITSRIFYGLSESIHDVIGGDPVKQTAVSINQLLPVVMRFIVQATGIVATNPSPGKWLFTPELRLYPGKSFPGDSPALDTYFQINGLNVYGLDSIYKLLLTATGPQALTLNLELGKPSNPLEVIIKNRMRVDYVGQVDVDESFDVRISLAGLRVNVALDMDMDLNELYLLRLSELSNSACLFAPFAFLKLDLDLHLDSLKLNVTHTPNTLGNNGNKLRDALAIASSEASSPNLPNMINYIFRSIRSAVSSSLSLVSNQLINSTNCAEETNAFDALPTRVLAAALRVNNFTELLSKATGLQPEPLAPELLDEQVTITFGGSPWDLRESAIIPVISKAIKYIPQSSYVRLLQTLGNGTGDVLQDSFVTENDGSVSLDVNFTKYFPTGFSLGSLVENGTLLLKRLRLTNLANLKLSNLQIVDPVSKFVTKTYIEIPGNMQFSIALDVDLPLAFKNPALTGVGRESLSLTVDLSDLIIDIELLAAVNKAKLDRFSIGSFFTLDENGQFGLNPYALNCIFPIFFPNGIRIPRLQIGVTSLKPTLSISPNTFISPGVVAVLQSMVEIFFDFVAKDLKDATQGGLRTFLNYFFFEHYQANPGTCKHPPIPKLPLSKQILDFQKSNLIAQTNHLLKDILKGSPANPYALFNSVVSGVFDGVVMLVRSATYAGAGFSDFELYFKGALLSIMDFHLYDVSLQNLGTFKQLNLLQPKTNTSFYNEISISGPLKATFTSELWVRELFEGYGPEGSKDQLKFELSITNISLSTVVNLELNMVDLLLVQTGSLTNLSQIACVVSPIDHVSFKDFNLDIAAASLDVSCAGTCNSPYFKSLQAGGKFSNEFNLQKITDIGAIVFKLLIDYLNSDDSTQDIDKALENADASCAVALNLTSLITVLNPPPSHGLNVAIIFGLGWLGVCAGLLCLIPALLIRHRQLKDRYIADALVRANNEPAATSQSVARYMAKEERLSIALAWHPAVRPCCRFIVPIICVVNVVLLVLSFVKYLNFEMSGNLYLIGQKTKTVTLVPWYISNTINDMWNSGAQPLALLVVFMSCAWPVIKNVLLFMIWYAPRHFLNHHRREWILVQMDILGKWSFLDIYVIVVFVGALRFSLVLGNAPLLQVVPIPDQAFVIDATIIPGTGIIMLCCAALASLVINHVIIWEMHKSEFSDERLFKIIDGVKDDMLTAKPEIRLAVSDYCFSSTNPEGQRDRYSPSYKNHVILLMGFTILFLFITFFLPYFTLTYDGLIGILIGFFIDGGRSRTLSLVSIGLKVMDATDGSAKLNIIFFFFQVTYFVTVCVAPIVHLLLNAYLWVTPMGLHQAKTVFFFSKVAAYWAALEVFALAIVATTIEVKPITNFLVDIITGNTCGAAKPVLEGALGEVDGQCLNPGAFLAWGFPLIFIANMIQITVGAIMLRANGVAIRDREEILEGKPHKPLSWTEYWVVSRLLAHNADHLRPTTPFLKFPFSSKRGSLNKSLLNNTHNNNLTVHGTEEQHTAVKAKTPGCLGCIDRCIGGVGDVSLTAPITSPVANKNSKWNAPTSPSMAMSSRPVTGSSYVSRGTNMPRYNAPTSIIRTPSHATAGQEFSDNPVFRQERRVASVDV